MNDSPDHASRRAFGVGLVALAGSAAATGAMAKIVPSTLTPGTVVERIKVECARQGIKWATTTVDTFKIGPTDSNISAIVSTFMATLDVMRQAVRQRANFIISHEPIFYNHFDETSALQDDPVYRAKVRFAQQHGLTVFRFHDHWHQIKPEPMSTASIAMLGWERYLDPGSSGFYRTLARPTLPLKDLAAEMAARLPSRSIRVIGRPDLPVSRIMTIGHGVDGVVRAFANADVAICPEIREWDSVEYARDIIEAGGNKALILISHERGEEDGMGRCRDWLASLVPERKISFINSGEPFATVR